MDPIAFVILSYNSFEDAARLCASILEARASEASTIILVDNLSPDRTGYEAWAGLTDPRVRRIESTTNGGYGAGNNQGIDLALSLGIDRVVILNPDVYLADTDTFLPLIDRLYAEENFLAAGFTVEGIHPYHASGLGSVLFPVPFRLLDRLRARPDQSAFPVGRIYGCAFAIHAHRFRELGLFDERMFMYQEEHLVSLLAGRSGERILQAGYVSVRHEAMGSFQGAMNPRQVRWMIDSMVHFLRVHRGMPLFLSRFIARFHVGQIALSYRLGSWLRRRKAV